LHKDRDVKVQNPKIVPLERAAAGGEEELGDRIDLTRAVLEGEQD
jgi:hypothetical protein